MMNERIIAEGWITSAQAAEILGVTITYIHRLVETGGLPEGRRIAGAERVTFFRVEDVEAYLDSHPNVGARRAVNQQSA